MRAGTLAAAAVASLALAACGATGKPSSAAGSAGSTNAVAWAGCLRSHGVPDFPDPISGHKAQFPDSAAGLLNSHSPAVLNAERACNKLKLLVSGSQASLGANQNAAFLEFAQCMRAHGVPNYPDPAYRNGRPVTTDLSSLGIDTQSPAFTAAARACSGHGIPLG
jgi:hypothetical protein